MGSGVSGTTARLEQGERSRALDFVGGYNLAEAGLARPAKAGDCIGKEAWIAQMAGAPAALLCTLRVDDHRSGDGQPRFPLGSEPVLTRAGELLVDAKGRRSFVTSAGSVPSLGRHLLFAYLPPDHARPGAPLAVEYFGERYPVTVAAVGPVQLVQPEPGPARS